MPGAGKRPGERYRGGDRPRGRLTPEIVRDATMEQLQKWSNGLNDAYDFDAVDASDFHNSDLVEREIQARHAAKRAAQSPLGYGVLPKLGLLDRIEQYPELSRDGVVYHFRTLEEATKAAKALGYRMRVVRLKPKNDSGYNWGAHA